MTGPGGAVDAEVVAVVVTRSAGLPAGADEAVAEAGGNAFLVGPDPLPWLSGLRSARRAWWARMADPLALAGSADLLAPSRLVVLPASPDGRDLAPHLAAALDRPLLAGSVACGLSRSGVWADLLRVDGRVVVPASCEGAAVVTLWPSARGPEPAGAEPETVQVVVGDVGPPVEGVEIQALVEPDPATMDLSEARRVIGGGAGLVPAASSDAQSRAFFALLAGVAAALGASAGATRVVTDAGWMPYDRQIGTTGVTLDPELYVALGVSGASQHVGGIGDPEHVVSVNVDPSCPMTALADLGMVSDAPSLLLELARRLGVPVPEELEMTVR